MTLRNGVFKVGDLALVSDDTSGCGRSNKVGSEMFVVEVIPAESPDEYTQYLLSKVRKPRNLDRLRWSKEEDLTKLWKEM